jgi:putative ABC transport system permease protein
VFLAALRDLQWRRKRFLITVVGTALVFAMSLLMSGISNGFSVEISRTLRQTGGDRWVAPTAAVGPFTAGINIDVDLLDAAVAQGAIPGVVRADPLLFTRSVAIVDGDPVDVNLFGSRVGALGAPAPSDGRPAEAAGEIVVASRLGSIGDTIELLGTEFLIVGTVPRASLFASPSVFMSLAEAQHLVANDQNRASMIVTEGVPSVLPAELRAFDFDDVAADLGRPLKNATQSIDLIRILLWSVAALIVASVIYLSALERTRDFAVFKATGSSTSSISLGLMLQAVTIALAASAIGAGLATLMAPRFPMDVSISKGSVLFMPVLATVVGVLASLIGMHRIATVQPAAAFGGP